jgi:hypothetical protein
MLISGCKVRASTSKNANAASGLMRQASQRVTMHRRNTFYTPHKQEENKHLRGSNYQSRSRRRRSHTRAHCRVYHNTCTNCHIISLQEEYVSILVRYVRQRASFSTCVCVRAVRVVALIVSAPNVTKMH